MKKGKKAFILIGIIIIAIAAILVLAFDKNYTIEGNLRSNESYYGFLEEK
ncbi:hypothetical protein KAU32_08760 [bacterium]|nr:hypothetical protein [bacterium]